MIQFVHTQCVYLLLLAKEPRNGQVHVRGRHGHRQRPHSSSWLTYGTTCFTIAPYSGYTTHYIHASKWKKTWKNLTWCKRHISTSCMWHIFVTAGGYESNNEAIYQKAWAALENATICPVFASIPINEWWKLKSREAYVTPLSPTYDPKQSGPTASVELECMEKI